MQPEPAAAIPGVLARAGRLAVLGVRAGRADLVHGRAEEVWLLGAWP